MEASSSPHLTPFLRYGGPKLGLQGQKQEDSPSTQHVCRLLLEPHHQLPCSLGVRILNRHPAGQRFEPHLRRPVFRPFPKAPTPPESLSQVYSRSRCRICTYTNIHKRTQAYPGAYTRTHTRSTPTHTSQTWVGLCIASTHAIQLVIYTREARVLLDTRLSDSSSSLEALRAPRQASEGEIPISIPTERVLGPRDSPRVPSRSSRRHPEGTGGPSGGSLRTPPQGQDPGPPTGSSPPRTDPTTATSPPPRRSRRLGGQGLP